MPKYIYKKKTVLGSILSSIGKKKTRPEFTKKKKKNSARLTTLHVPANDGQKKKKGRDKRETAEGRPPSISERPRHTRSDNRSIGSIMFNDARVERGRYKPTIPCPSKRSRVSCTNNGLCSFSVSVQYAAPSESRHRLASCALRRRPICRRIQSPASRCPGDGADRTRFTIPFFFISFKGMGLGGRLL